MMNTHFSNDSKRRPRRLFCDTAPSQARQHLKAAPPGPERMGLWTVRRGCGGNQTLLRLLALHMATISLFHIALLVEAQDVAPPTWIAGYPVVASRTGTSVTLATQISEAGLVYAVVVPFGSTAPTPSEVKARTGHGGSTAVASASKVSHAPKATNSALLHVPTTAK